ncbi:MAG TPA: rhodanese-like domain-containing protein [Microvirga sp.]|jgi:TolB-like protein/class 3 adenylate cyclase/rhodanese-related sulfurtransferase|nr:rhodanese-like domain-containing protein [Microvirga sp.]
MAADIVGYSRLVEMDENGALAAIKALRREVVDPLLAEHHGRIVKLMGDGAIAEFGSVVDAATFAITMQKEVAARQAQVPPDHRIVFRIGINLGDVVVDDDDLLGDGVNVAARLEQLCAPGGVLVSGTAYDHLHGKIDLPLEFTGEQHVKNISRPVRTYRIRLDGRHAGWRFKLAGLRQWRLPTAVALAVLAGGAFLWWPNWEPQAESAMVERASLPLPDKPSIAVLPFDSLGSDSEQVHFADGISEDLITDLSKLSGIFVIARNSSWTYKGKPTKVQKVAAELGVRYVLEGSVRRQGDQVRINAQLIDAISGHHLWAERYDGLFGDMFAFQEKVIGQIVAALAVELTGEEQARIALAETKDSRAYDALLRGWEHLRRETEPDTLKAIALFEKAVELDPGYHRAYAALATGYWRVAVSSWTAANVGMQRAFEQMNANMARAMAAPNAPAYALSAEVLARQGRNDEALAKIKRALELAPNDPDHHVSQARILNAVGRAAEAERDVRWAMRLNPQHPPGYLRVLALSLFHQERYGEAIDLLHRLVSLPSPLAEDYATLVSAYGHVGQREGIGAAIEKYNALTVPVGFDPLTVQESGWWWYGDMFDYHREYRDRYLAGLRKAGVPEGAGVDLTYDEYTSIVSKRDGEYFVEGAPKIDAVTAKGLHDRGARFVDVRSAVAHRRGHIPGAHLRDVVITLSRETLSEVAGPDDEVVFYCYGRYCPMSAFASAKALKWGFSRVYYFAGGYPAWVDNGYPVESASTQ